MNKNEILTEFYTSPTSNTYNKNKLKNQSLVDALLLSTNFLNSSATISERLYCLKNDTIPNTCDCGLPTKFKSPKVGYAEFCSTACIGKSTKIKEKRKTSTIASSGGCGFASEKIKNKVKQTNLDRYGVENATQNVDIAAKIEETWKTIDKPSILEKRKKTNLEKYGAEYHQQNIEQQQKIQESLLKNQGGIGFSSEKISDKVKETNKIRFGVENAMENTDIQLKMKAAVFEKYGVHNVMQHEEISRKRRDNNVEKWGVENNSQRHISRESLDILYCPVSFEKHLVDSSGAYALSKELGVSIHTVLHKIKEFGIVYETQGTFTSSFETEIVNFLNIHNVSNIIQSDRKILNGKELDIVLPNKHIAIEMNGVYWHSEHSGNKDKFYHFNKTEMAKKVGYQLLHIYDTEWLHKNSIIKSMILSKIGHIPTRIYARKCSVKEISSVDKNNFLLENHLQGKDAAGTSLGLFFEDTLYAVMTFGKSRFSKKYEWELVRFANKQFTSIVGGASKLFTYFVNNFSPSSIVTYADKRYSDGTFYEKIGFTKLHESEPNYHYWKSNNPLFDDKLFSRNRFQKHKLSNILEKFDTSLSEWDNMVANGYDRIWDCGNFVFGWSR